VQTNIEFFKNIIGSGFAGMFIYVFVTILAVVLAPVSTMPLVPIASNLWGTFIAAILSIIGWSIGAFIAFIIARIYGAKIVEKIIPLKKLHEYEKLIPQKNIFFGIILLRIIIPVDLLSYALGIFSKVKLRTYMIATVIGIAPFAFIWAYLGKIPFYYQILIFLIVLVVLTIAYFLRGKDIIQKTTQII